MRPPPKLSFLGTVALLFLLCQGSISYVFARVPLVRRQSNVEGQGAQAFPGVSDDPLDPLGNNILNEQVVADTYPVCCEQKESLIEKTTTICERGMSFSLNLQVIFFSPFLVDPFYLLDLSLPPSLCTCTGER